MELSTCTVLLVFVRHPVACMALVSSHQNNGTVVQAVQSAGHQEEGTMGDEGRFIQDNQVVAIQGEVDICYLLWVHRDVESHVDGLGM